ncbi:MFS transporter [Kineosporia sp. NBRC 101731]|nr:MFS transporter [Kineosporia sp. NBRC 101731]
MQSVGAQWFLVEHSHSASLVALVQTASLLPVLALSLPAGVLADSLDRRRLLVVTTALSAVAATVLVGLDATGVLAPWSLLTATFALGCLSALTSPAWQAIQPELVPREEIPAAASLGSVTVNAARAIGPAAAGLIVGFTGPWSVFALNALSFIGVLVVLLRWDRPQRPAPLAHERFGEALLAGTRYVRSAPGVRRILLRAGLFAVPACALWALLPTVATGTLGLGSGGYGVLLGVLGAGAVLGVFALPALRRRLSSSWLLAGSAITYAVGCAAPALGSVWLLVPVFLVTGTAWIVTLTTLNAALQLSLAGWVRARGVAFYLLVFMGGQGVASFVWGLVADAIGSSDALLIAAGLLVLTGLSVTVLPLRAATGTLDRTVTALSSGAPELVFEPDPTDGPVTVEIEYTVRPGEAAAFVTAMKGVERSRRRTGAISWRLERGGENDHTYREQFAVRSWGEYTRAGQERWTGFDHETLDAALTHVEGTARSCHYFPVP